MTVQAPWDEEANIRERYWSIQKGDVVLDVGSYLGTYTLPALDAGATVYAIDTRLETLKELKKTAKAAGLARRLTTLHNTVGKPYSKQLLAEIAASPHPSSRDMAPEDGPCVTLDRIVEAIAFDLPGQLERVDWLKVDVEGGELEVIRGAKQTLRKLRPFCLIEDHSRIYPWVAKQQTTRHILQLLADAGYDSELLVEPFVDYIIGTPR